MPNAAVRPIKALFDPLPDEVDDSFEEEDYYGDDDETADPDEAAENEPYYDEDEPYERWRDDS